jgi:hypothetical protein
MVELIRFLTRVAITLLIVAVAIILLILGSIRSYLERNPMTLTTTEGEQIYFDPIYASSNFTVSTTSGAVELPANLKGIRSIQVRFLQEIGWEIEAVVNVELTNGKIVEGLTYIPSYFSGTSSLGSIRVPAHRVREIRLR